jgi:hypothetical protein
MRSFQCRSGDTAPRFVRLLLTLAFVLSSLAGAPISADELGEHRQFWEQSAFLCAAPGMFTPAPTPFPSKIGPGSASPQLCDDGDMTLFNGLLCAAGDQRGCAAVKASQDRDGRFWRSPRRLGMDSSNGSDVSFSEDQALGVMLYLLQSNDASAFDNWAIWVASHRPCLVMKNGTCDLPGWPRFCTDDSDNRCAMRPMNCLVLDFLADRFGQPTIPGNGPGTGCDLVMGMTYAVAGGLAPALSDLLSILHVIEKADFDTLTKLFELKGDPERDIFPCGWPPDVGSVAQRLSWSDLEALFSNLRRDSGFGHARAYPLSAQLDFEAGVTCPGYPLHKVAVRLMLLDRISARDALADAAARSLIGDADHPKQPENPFFRFLADKSDTRVKPLLLEQCPTIDRDSQKLPPEEWTWERVTTSQPWTKSMYWECIFLAELIVPR